MKNTTAESSEIPLKKIKQALWKWATDPSDNISVAAEDGKDDEGEVMEMLENVTKLHLRALCALDGDERDIQHADRNENLWKGSDIINYAFKIAGTCHAPSDWPNQHQYADHPPYAIPFFRYPSLHQDIILPNPFISYPWFCPSDDLISQSLLFNEGNEAREIPIPPTIRILDKTNQRSDVDDVKDDHPTVGIGSQVVVHLLSPQKNAQIYYIIDPPRDDTSEPSPKDPRSIALDGKYDGHVILEYPPKNKTIRASSWFRSSHRGSGYIEKSVILSTPPPTPKLGAQHQTLLSESSSSVRASSPHRRIEQQSATNDLVSTDIDDEKKLEQQRQQLHQESRQKKTTLFDSLTLGGLGGGGGTRKKRRKERTEDASESKGDGDEESEEDSSSSSSSASSTFSES